MSRHPTRLALLVLCLLLGACKTAPKAQANNLLAAGDPCDPTSDHELCVYESTFVRLGCNASTSLWQLLGECALTDVCQEFFAPGAPDQRLTRCAPFSEVHDAGATTGSDVIGGPDTASATDTGSTKDVAKDSAPTTDAQKSDVAATSCGDGHCDPGETTTTCPADCPPPLCGDGVCAAIETCWLDCSSDGLARSGCLKGKCPNQTSACLADDACVSVLVTFLQCMASGCSGASNCFGVCQPLVANNIAANNVATCGVTTCFAAQFGQCGDGVCSSTEGPTTCPKDCKPATTGSCAGACGGASTDCHCDPPCVKVGDCCSDYVQQCTP